ncbi:MAG: hypothetical protein RI967_1536 [Planctomycetota bacterium]
MNATLTAPMALLSLSLLDGAHAVSGHAACTVPATAAAFQPAADATPSLPARFGGESESRESKSRESESRDSNSRDLESRDLESRDAWRFDLTPYLWVPAQDGHATIKGVTAPIDLSVGDTFEAIGDYFNFAAAVHVEASRDGCTLFGDAMFLSLEADGIQLPSEVATVRMNQGLFELGAALAVLEVARGDDAPGFVFEPLAGARVYTLYGKFSSSLGYELSQSEAWVDGFFGARARVEFSDALGIHLRGDVGGGGSSFCWNVNLGVDIRLCDAAVLELGYRALSVDYGTGSGADRFEYDLVLQGPYLGLTFGF